MQTQASHHALYIEEHKNEISNDRKKKELLSPIQVKLQIKAERKEKYI